MKTKTDWNDLLYETLPYPNTWPKRYRRLFLLTLPISGPLYMLYIALLIGVTAILLCALLPMVWVVGIWYGDDE